MTGNRIEQVTPRIHPQTPNQPSRTWQPRKIRLHDDNPSSLQYNTTRVRVTAPSSAFKTTPVTHPTPSKPLRFRIAGTQPELGDTCRRLFPNSTPTKRPYHPAPSFRFSCGRERTQPRTNHTRTHFVNALDAQVEQAHENLCALQEALSNQPSHTSLQRVASKGLFFEVVGRQHNLLVLKSLTHLSDQQPSEVAVVATDEMFSENIKQTSQLDFSAHVVHIPYPWHAQIVDKFNVCGSRIRVLLAVHKMDVFRREKLSSLADIPMNSELGMLMNREPNIANKEAPNPHPRYELRFAALSPHMSAMNLSVFVDFRQANCDIAIVRDDAEELGVLIAQNIDLEMSSEKVIVGDVSILPHRMPSTLILEILGDRCEDKLYNRLAVPESGKSHIVFKHNKKQPEMHS